MTTLYVDNKIQSIGNIDRAVRHGVLVFVFGFVGFLLWAFLAPLGQGVPAVGVVKNASEQKAISHMQGGVVKDIFVKEGARVKQGEVLMSLDGAIAKANHDSLITQQDGFKAEAARLMAERGNLAGVKYPSELLAKRHENSIAELLVNQDRLFESRRMALQTDLVALEAMLKSSREQFGGQQNLVSSRKHRVELMEAELKSYRQLAEKGFISRVKLSETERVLSEAQSDALEAMANLSAVQARLVELEGRIRQRRQQYVSEADTRLAEVESLLAQLKDRSGATGFDVAHSEIRSPVDGVVTGLKVHTKGGIVRPGEPILGIVPDGDPLIVEAKVSPNDIENIHASLPTEIRFSSFDPATTPPVPGVVENVSADRFTDTQTGQSYYVARINISPEIAALINKPIMPGMPADVVIKTGERTLMQYLIGPLKVRIAKSLLE